ncbi:MAG: hypothetical protein QXX94_04070 [Candidatus Bathyarchaeia archaeon]
MSKSAESISKGIDISIKNPILFVPYAAPIIIQLIFGVLAYTLSVRYFYTIQYFDVGLYMGISLLGSLIAAIFGFIAGCMLVDMSNDAISGRPVDLRKSLNLVMGKIGTLIIAAIIAALCSITIILLPIAIFIIVIAILDEIDAIESTKKALNFVANNIGEVFIIIVIVVGAIASFGLSFIPVVGPFIGAIVNWFLNAIFTVSAVYFYISLRPPPPPPPPFPT